ncbi:MAG: sulfite exporter TauE/SafE family protein [Solirubrobacterales bacterium]|nr:sulfite exporter TauE/SafE family protein [Solirubrobacterales bacterium]MCB8971894.1 sulfite exporter TauE/SafE family protein [Thermoleophilales bacterium]MCO5326301.1 sulfite exporter TauE/SafE family protein [Solirubrobacterales bacterium]
MDPGSLLLIASWSFAVALAGGTAGLVLGNLRLPVVLLFATSAAAGAGANVAISGVAAAAAASIHIRAGRVNWRLLWLMGPPSLVGGIVGGVISGALPSRVLLGVISVVVLYGAVETARHGQRQAPAPASEPHRLAAVATGLGVGVLGGIVGLILGTLRLPAMLRWVGVDAQGAVATNSAIGVMLALGAVIGHLGGDIDWNIALAGSTGAIPGALLGAHLVGRFETRTLLRVVAVVLVVSGLAMAATAIAG